MISTAWAAEAASLPDPWHHHPTFWVAVAFVLTFVIFGKKLYTVISTGLDDRAETIRNQIEEAQRLREEAQQMLADYQRKQREAADEAKTMVEHAKTEAEHLRERLARELEASLKRREQQAMDRIRQAESTAVQEVRSTAADLAVEATRKVVEENAGKAAKGNALIDAAIKELPDRMH